MEPVALKTGDDRDIPYQLPLKDLEAALGIHPGRRLLCANCGQPVTTEAERISIEGRSVHQATNPSGIEFEFGCFASAPGALVAGEPTTEFSWFTGYAWRFALCRGCGAHLGWFFQGGAPTFFGLILNRLKEEGPEEGTAP